VPAAGSSPYLDALAKQASIDARVQGAAEVTIETAAGEYKPKVSTWGVFPRPQNISQAYGGGREIIPGQSMRSAEENARRDAELQEALDRFKRKAGLAWTPEEQEALDATLGDADLYMRNGRLRLAVQKFDAVIEQCPFKTRYGGMARIKKAICLDSMGPQEREIAREMYKELKAHPEKSIQKQAQQMLFSFTAAQDLKVGGGIEQLSYADLFERLQRRSQGYTQYVPKEGEEEEVNKQNNRNAALAILFLVVAPTGLFLALSALR